jgi:hypothetical protein
MTPKSKSGKSTPSKKAAGRQPISGWVPTHFFQEQLKGEQALTYDTAAWLYSLAYQLITAQPWMLLRDGDLILLKDRRTGEMNYCSVMGAGGEVFSFQIYRGDETYRMFRKVASGAKLEIVDFIAVQNGISVEFVGAKEVTRPDRDWLNAFGHPKDKGIMSPILRTIRPGYQPWYVTETEGLILAECLDAGLTFFEELLQTKNRNWWEKEDVYPFLVPKSDEPDPDYEIQTIRAPEPPMALPQPPTPDETRMRNFTERDFAVAGPIEIDLRNSMVRVGRKNERPGFIRLALAADAESGFLYAPHMPTPGQSVGDALATTLLDAIENIGAVPKEVRVKRSEFKALLDPMARRLGSTVVVKKSLPALDPPMEQMLRMVEGG